MCIERGCSALSKVVARFSSLKEFGSSAADHIEYGRRGSYEEVSVFWSNVQLERHRESRC